MFNTRKLLGIIVGLAGVVVVRANLGFEAGSSQVFFVKTVGVMIACVGIAVFASGIRNKVEKKIRLCPHCYAKNAAEKEFCRRCKKLLKTLA